MTGYIPGPDIVPSPWIDDIPDEAAAILHQTLSDLAMACEERYERQIEAHRERLRARFIDPDRPWMPRPAESTEDLSRDDPEDLAADFSARQLDLFLPEAEWDNDF